MDFVRDPRESCWYLTAALEEELVRQDVKLRNVTVVFSAV